MYEFKYGVTPSDAKDRKYCQLKGDSGLYGVDEISKANGTVTISSIGAYATRDREVKPLKNIRFISDERYQEFKTLTKPKNSVEDEGKVGKPLVSVLLPNTDGLRFSIHEALLGMGIGDMVLTDTHFVLLLNKEDQYREKMWVNMNLSQIQEVLTAHSKADEDEAENLLHALNKGIFIGEQYSLFDPLHSDKPCDVVITSVNRDAIKYKKLNAKGELGKIEKILNSRHSRFLTRK